MLLSTISAQLYRYPVDMRKSIDGLMLVVLENLSSNPSDGVVYVFINKGQDKLKLLYWDRNGFCVLYKRLEKQKFKIPAITEKSLHLKSEQLRWLLDGLDVSKLQGFKTLKYSRFC